MKKVFLGGTCNGSDWRKKLIPKLKIDYFNPVVEDQTELDRLIEIRERNVCDYVLYVLTKDMKGIYSIAEVTDDSNKRPERTILCVLKDGFNDGQIKSFEALEDLVSKNGATVLHSLDEVVEHLNK